ncbi:MAG: nicotinate (nicotinamide) nucleotide adenylyltransferase [Chlorobiaceae bacterium]|nr:nicotinate (nicotinamide) nucleotide adenylyltransferase [Chlorobiaceae bacterium]MBA4309624.1 nicotinate (nicotinamide) nucleotide adenylyltransferase [Chlorobiaceae bacterium]
MSRVGIYGGNFDPIHFGHLITAQFVLENRDLEKIIFIPANISPFKEDKIVSESIKRFEMLNAAIKEYPQFTSSDIELKKSGKSFTIYTLNELHKIYSSIDLIIGYDNFVEFEKWKSPDEIIELVDVIVLRRNNENLNFENRFTSKVTFLTSPLIEINSTEIRERVKNNLPIDFLVPKTVKEYIYQNKLYK